MTDDLYDTNFQISDQIESNWKAMTYLIYLNETSDQLDIVPILNVNLI